LSHNFFIADVIGSSLALVLFGLFALVPGYVIAWTIQLLDFRRRTFLAQLTLSIPLSIGVSPVLAYLLGRFLSMDAVWLLFGLIWLAFLAISALKFRSYAKRLPPRKALGIYCAIVCGWLVVGLISLVDVQIRNRLYFSVVSFDYSLRTAVVSSISRTGIPPANPYFFPGHLVQLRYHYFWLILCSLVNQLGGALVSSRQAIIGGTLWSGLGLIASVPLYLRFVHPAGARDIHRRSLLGIALLAVTGLDLLPNLMLDIGKAPLPDPEWWNNQISSWTTSVLCVPHHTAALIAGLMGVLIIWNYAQADTPWIRTAWMAVAGLCLATCVGSSIYVGFVFGAALALWTCIVILNRWHKEGLFLIGTGLLALLAVARQLLDLHGPFGAGGNSGPLFIFRVRDFVLSGAFTGWGRASALRINMVNALLLPLNYFGELGAFFVCGIWTLRRWRSSKAALSRYELVTLTLAGSSIMICTFLRSTVIANNDLGSRGFLLAQFVLLLWMVDVVELSPSLSAAQHNLLGLLLVIGALGSVYEAGLLRVYPVLADALDIPRFEWLCSDHNLGRRTYALREGYEELKGRLPATAIVQHNPNAVPDDLPYGLYADRPVVAESPACGVGFGGDPQSCAAVQAQLRPIFEGISDADTVDRACTVLSISGLLVKDTDPVWVRRDVWVWRRQPITSNRFMRILPCGESFAAALQNSSSRGFGYSPSPPPEARESNQRPR
jgi:hypothetical protein